MKIESICIKNFRNLADLEIKFCPEANIIYGSNGQGKTNLLESIWMFTGSRSFRGAKDSQLVTFSQPKAAVTITYWSQDREQQAKMEIENQRKFWRNDICLKLPGEMAMQFCAVLFSPDQLSLVRGGPVEKRRFLDVSISQLRPRYGDVLNQYQRALEQRNHVLKNAWKNDGNIHTLQVWEERMAAYGAIIIKTRATYLTKLNRLAQDIYRELSQEREVFFAQYQTGGIYNEDWDLEEIQKGLIQYLSEKRQEDIRAGFSTVGPHRDDISILLDGKPAREYGSQGQQRSCVLALKLAESKLMEETLDEAPILLLDDVMSELDVQRREYLLNRLKGRQLLLTCCDKAYFQALGSGYSFKLEQGSLTHMRRYNRRGG